ncbi:MAG: sugar transferase [Bacteroidia bacterium]|jgi:lipopolysaccharide/colanic/teichoic acid biosynthesis glycosyltransferase
MKVDNSKKLVILHLGPDPEFQSQVFVEGREIQIPTTDNIFSVCQWVSANGLPDAVICEQKLPGGDGIAFHDFWIEQFDPNHKIPFLLLDDKKAPELIKKAQEKEIDSVYFKPVTVETLVNQILTLKKNKTLTNSLINGKAISSSWYKTPVIKRISDIITAFLLLLIVSPFLLIFAIAILLESRGRIYYVSKRVGTGYNLFDFYQLRTMYSMSGRRLKEISRLNHDIQKTSELNQDNIDAADPRISKVGLILRKLHLDELPQLFNVLKGDLSIVGNRPLKIHDAELLTPEDLTHRMAGPAGVIGLWKLKSQRRLKRMSREERRALDNKYYKIAQRKFSVWSDLWIIARTIPIMLRRGNR